MYITLVCCDVRANFTFQGKKERGKKKSGFLVSFYTLLRPDWFENKKGFLLLYKNNVIMNETERRSNNIGNEA